MFMYSSGGSDTEEPSRSHWWWLVRGGLVHEGSRG